MGDIPGQVGHHNALDLPLDPPWRNRSVSSCYIFSFLTMTQRGGMLPGYICRGFQLRWAPPGSPDGAPEPLRCFLPAFLSYLVPFF